MFKRQSARDVRFAGLDLRGRARQPAARGIACVLIAPIPGAGGQISDPET